MLGGKSFCLHVMILEILQCVFENRHVPSQFHLIGVLAYAEAWAADTTRAWYPRVKHHSLDHHLVGIHKLLVEWHVLLLSQDGVVKLELVLGENLARHLG